MKKIVSLVLLVGSITFGLLMIFGASKLNQQNDETALKALSEEFSRQHDDGQNAFSAISEDNITEEFIETASEKIASEVISMNPEGPQMIEGEQWLNVPDPEALANKIFEEKITNFDVNQLKSVVKITDLKIVPDSELSITTYVQNLQNTLSTYLFKIPEQPSIKDIDNITSAYQKVIPLLYAIEAPQSAASIHQQAVALLETRKNIFEKFSNAENDPLAAILALNLLPNINQETNDFTEKINKLK